MHVRRQSCDPDGRLKDTVANIQRTNEFVVNMTDEPLAQAMHESSGDFPPDIGEPGYLGLKLAPSTKDRARRGWPTRRLRWNAGPGRRSTSTSDRLLIIGEGIHFHIRDELWDPAAMRVHMDRYHPIGRMFADRYCRTDDRIMFPAAKGPEAK